MNCLKIGCVVMAAGNGSRFGENKLTAVINGKPMIRHALEAVPHHIETVVVTQHEAVVSLAKKFCFQTLINSHPELGISHTIELGTRHLCHCDGILYMVSDQPMLRQSSVEEIVATWKAHPDYIVGASHMGVRGNPCLFPREFFPALLSLSGDRGGNQIIRENEDRLLLVEIHKNELTDVDTKDTLEEIQKKMSFQ